MSPVNVSSIGAYIREQREQAKISLRQLAQSAGISNPYLSQIERGLRRPSADILQQIAKGLRISAEALYVQAGFLEDRPPGSMVRDAVLSDLELSERQKQMLIEIYESFRKETAIARAAEDAELLDDQSGLTPDEAALTWPENMGRQRSRGGPGGWRSPRRIATPTKSATGTTATMSMTRMSPVRSSVSGQRWATTSGDRAGRFISSRRRPGTGSVAECSHSLVTAPLTTSSTPCW